jgi:hypothetical protein
MRRILLVLSVALILTLMLTAPAGAKNGALVIHDPESCTTITQDATNCKAVVTPSGRINANAHFRPQQTTPPRENDGATVLNPPEDCKIGKTQATRCHAVGTPSGRENAHAHLDLQQ